MWQFKLKLLYIFVTKGQLVVTIRYFEVTLGSKTSHKYQEATCILHSLDCLLVLIRYTPY